MIQGVLFVLLLFGIYVLNRISSRDRTLAILDKLLNKIRKYFASKDSELKKYISLRKKTFRRTKQSNKILYIFKILFGGSIRDLVIICNSIFCSGIVMSNLINKGIPINLIVIWTSITMIIMIVIFQLYFIFIRKILIK